MGRTYQRGSLWWVEYWHRGRQYRESSGSTREVDATRLLKKRLKEMGKGNFVGPQEERVTVEELLQDLETDYQIRGRKSIVTLRANLKAIRAAFGDDRALDVTASRLRRVVALWQQEKVANATINRRVAALQRAFSLAREAGKISSAPHFPTLTEHNARQGFFERGEFLAVLEKLPEDLRDFAEWAYWTGMRKGEIASLTWASFDRETWTIRLHSKDAKTGKGRILALEGPLRDIIQRRAGARRLDCPLIFHRDGKAVREFRRSWKTACGQAKVPERRFHDLRRTGVRNLVRAGVPQSVAMAISGHRTAQVFRRYDITSEQDLREAVAKVHAYVESLPKERNLVPLKKAAGAVA